MKTLKFMLAAATAIGLASASQAAGPYRGSTDFESDTLNSTITTSDAYWTVPAGAEDGDYTIVAGNPVSDQVSPAVTRSAGAVSKFGNTTEKVLKLEGGTDPLLRNIQATGTAVNLTAGDVYIDTLVKFTVTPDGDTVEPGADDKLLIYLKEDLTSGSEVTNLMVVAAAHSPRNDDDEVAEQNTTNPVVVASNVLPNTWYRLTVKSFVKKDSANADVPVFKIYLNGTELTSGNTVLFGGEETADYTLFPSLKGSATATLSAVGFAGSGSVDDLLFTTFDPAATVVDFYLALDDAGGGISGDVFYTASGDNGKLGSAALTEDGQQVFCAYTSGSPSVTVSYTMSNGYTATWSNGTTANGNDTFTPASGVKYTLTVTPVVTGVDFTFARGTGVSAVTWTLNGTAASGTVQVKENDVLAITGVTYANWYVGSGDYTNGWTKTLAAADVAANFTYTVQALELGNSSAELPSGTQPSAVGISNAAITSSDLNPVLEWARTKSGAADTAEALDVINGMDFTAENQAAKAYLLNCANTQAAVEAAEAAFKFTAITPGTVPEVYVPVGGYNATPVIYGGNTVDAINVTPATGSHKFYKATLTK